MWLTTGQVVAGLLTAPWMKRLRNRLRDDTEKRTGLYVLSYEMMMMMMMMMTADFLFRIWSKWQMRKLKTCAGA